MKFLRISLKLLGFKPKQLLQLVKLINDLGCDSFVFTMYYCPQMCGFFLFADFWCVRLSCSYGIWLLSPMAIKDLGIVSN